MLRPVSLLTFVFLVVTCGGRTTTTTGHDVGGQAGMTGGVGATTSGASGAGNLTNAGTGGPVNQMSTGATGGLVMAGGATGTGEIGSCSKPMLAEKALVAADILADFEGMAPGAIAAVTPGGGWYSYKDAEVGTMFTPDPAAWMVETPGNGGIGSALHVAGAGFMGPTSATNWGAGTGFSLGGSIPGGIIGMATQPTDVSAYSGISFYAKSSMMSDISVQFATPDTDPAYCTCQAASLCYAAHGVVVPMVAAAWTKYTVKFVDLRQPPYIMAPIPFDPTSVLTINFASNGPLPAFDFWLDDITLVK